VLSEAAHGLRGPLIATSSAVGLLLEDFDDLPREDIQASMQTVHGWTLRLEMCVENLLVAASIRNGRLRMARQDVSLETILRQSVAALQPVFRQRDQAVQVNVRAGTYAVHVDSRRFAQAVINLLGLVGDRAAAGTTLTVCLEPGGAGTIRATIEGVPTPPAGSRPRPSAEEALSLSVARSLVELQDGRLRQPSPTTFVITVPLALAL
jgi:signal transduction histidine kinase